jgi:hypothetical protein
MSGTNTVDWSAAGAMIGGLGAWAQLAAAVVGVLLAYKIGSQQNRSALDALKAAREREEAAASGRRTDAYQAVILCEKVVRALSAATALVRRDSAMSMSLSGWSERLQALAATTRHYLEREALPADLVAALAAAQAAVCQASACVTAITSPSSRPGDRMGAGMDIEAIARRLAELITNPDPRF